jgi:hypothetical protein
VSLESPWPSRGVPRASATAAKDCGRGSVPLPKRHNPWARSWSMDTGGTRGGTADDDARASTYTTHTASRYIRLVYTQNHCPWLLLGFSKATILSVWGEIAYLCDGQVQYPRHD